MSTCSGAQGHRGWHRVQAGRTTYLEETEHSPQAVQYRCPVSLSSKRRRKCDHRWKEDFQGTTLPRPPVPMAPAWLIPYPEGCSLISGFKELGSCVPSCQYIFSPDPHGIPWEPQW